MYDWISLCWNIVNAHYFLSNNLYRNVQGRSPMLYIAGWNKVCIDNNNPYLGSVGFLISLWILYFNQI